jgi:trypsin-like peptidase
MGRPIRASARVALVAASCCGLLACQLDAADVEWRREPIVYGSDGRAEYFDVGDPTLRERMARSIVALVPNEWLDAATGTLAASAPTWQEADAICPDELYASQPSVAFCSGVLVDWDLVLTAGHCMRLLAPADYRVVFGYHYLQPGTLALQPGGLATPVEIVDEALDPAGTDPRFDHAWLRLASPVPAPYAPVPVYRAPPPVRSGDPVKTIGAPHGMPLKADATGVVADPRGFSDYFLAKTDTSGGWSGGGAFDAQHALIGILSRGADDLTAAPADGCAREARAGDADPGQEQFTYAFAALRSLCAKEPSRSLCRADCSEPCMATPPPTASGDEGGSSGCAISPGRPDRRAGPALAVLLGACLRRFRRRLTRPPRL